MNPRAFSPRTRRRSTALAATLLSWAATFPGGGAWLQAGALQAQSPVPGARGEALFVPARAETAASPSLRRHPLDVRVAPEGALHRVVLSDGRVYYGSMVSGGDPVRLGFPEGGIAEIARDRIVRIDEVQGTLVDGEFWPRDPNHSRLIFAPTGRSLPRGTGSVNAYYGVMPFVAWGLTDRLTVAGGISLLEGDGLDLFPSRAPFVPAVGDEGASGRTVHLAPKLQVLRGRRVEAAVGVLLFVPTRDPAAASGMGYGTGTAAIDSRTSLTVGVGMGARHGERQDEATWMVGGDRRVSRRLKFLTENYRFPGGETLHMGGVRIVGEQLSADLAVAFRPGGPEPKPIPVLNVSFGW
jgi:hypothetical protein